MSKNYTKKFSLILAVWNGEGSVKEAVLSAFDLNYPKQNYEIVVLDDGSSDNTYRILQNLEKEAKKRGVNYRVFRHVKNKGMLAGRITAASKAKNERIVIFDHQAFFDADYLQKASQYDSKLNLISNYYMQKDRSIDDRVLYLVRKKIYAPYWGTKFPSVEITQKNFNKISKGSGGFITNKKSFLKYCDMIGKEKIPRTKNEDTRLFQLYLENGERIMRVYDVKMLYKNRTGTDSLNHLYRRGPRFVDFYFKQGKIFDLLGNNKLFYLLLVLALLSFVSVLVASFIYPLLLIAGLALLWILNSILALYLAEDGLDMIACFVYFPIVLVVFLGGVLRGIKIHYLIR